MIAIDTKNKRWHSEIHQGESTMVIVQVFSTCYRNDYDYLYPRHQV